MRILIALVVSAVSGVSAAQVPNVTVKNDGLSLENEVRAACNSNPQARVRDDEAGRRIVFLRGNQVIATMWRAPIHFGNWNLGNDSWFEVEISPAATQDDVSGLTACMGTLVTPPRNGALVIHR